MGENTCFLYSLLDGFMKFHIKFALKRFLKGAFIAVTTDHLNQRKLGCMLKKANVKICGK